MNRESTYTTRREVKLTSFGPTELYAVINIEAFAKNVAVSIQHESRWIEPKYPDDIVIKDVLNMDVSWADLDNVENLALIFCAQRVDVFGPLVEMLGKVYRKKELIQGLLEA